MTGNLTALATRLCRALKDDTAGRPMQWRAIDKLAPRCRLPRAVAAEAATFAEQQGWLTIEGGHSVCLTEAGRRL